MRLDEPRSVPRSVAIRLTLGAALASVATVAPLRAQTDFYNTSTGRPMRVEDALPLEYRAIELDIAPLRLERLRGGVRRWSAHPEVAIGILPRTQLQIGLPLANISSSSPSVRGVAGVEISAMHALNTETSIPALALAAELFLPAGPLGGDAAYGTLKGMLTRTMPWARIHANAQLTVGAGVRTTVEADDLENAEADASRWLVGAAIDKTFPLRSLLISAESFVEQPVVDDADAVWSVGSGARYQLTPRWAVDGGIGRRLTGTDRAWYLTLGWAYALGIP